MPTIIHGRYHGQGRRVTLVASRFNELVVERLVAGCLAELARLGVADEDCTVIWTPGAFELPQVAARAAAARCDAVICLGAVIRGGTPHFEYVAGEAARGVAGAARESGKPVIFGVLTTDTLEQALERAGAKAGNKGADAARAALEMIDVLAQLDGAP